MKVGQKSRNEEDGRERKKMWATEKRKMSKALHYSFSNT